MILEARHVKQASKKIVTLLAPESKIGVPKNSKLFNKISNKSI